MVIEPIKREDLSLALKGRSHITNHLREILQNATKEVIICTNSNEVNKKLKLFQQMLEELKKENINVKLALSGDANMIKQFETKFNTKIKKVDINAKFFIIDRKEILFYLSKDTDEEDNAVWLNSEFFSQAFASLFDIAMK